MRTDKIRIDSLGGRYVATVVAFEHALTLGKKRLAKDMAEALSNHGQRRAEATKTYWMKLPVAVLAVIWADAYHGHDDGDECDVCSRPPLRCEGCAFEEHVAADQSFDAGEFSGSFDYGPSPAHTCSR
jgi:hypothetical protein